MGTPIVEPKNEKLKIIGYCSGSGNTLWAIHDLQKKLEAKNSCKFEIVAVFTDNPNSKAARTAASRAIPCESLNIKEFYKKLGEPLSNKAIRKLYDKKSLELLKPYNADMIILAGYVWVTSDVVLDNYFMINVHPADLSIVDDNGNRLLAGANGVKAALDLNMPYICSTSHIATKKLDGGPILFRSPDIPIDYNLHDSEEARFRYYLSLVNEYSRKLGAVTIQAISNGSFTKNNNVYYYKDKIIKDGYKISNW